MVPKKINRINMQELKQITIRCQRCNVSTTVGSEAGSYTILVCPACRAQYSEDAENILFSEKEQRGFHS